MSRDDTSQFARPAEEERKLASSAADPRAAKAHRELAERYDAVARAYRNLSGRHSFG